MASDNSFLVERSTVVKAAPDAVQALLDNFHKWPQWSPWEGQDPALKRTYTGPDSGVGAAYSWAGNRKAGAGSMKITESVPGERVVLDLHFTKPFKTENVTKFLLTPEADGTRVVWQMTGQSNFFFALVGKIFPMDKVVGKDFEKGLAQLKSEAEKA